MNRNCWLPKLECFDEYDNDWNKYQDILYTIFHNDFVKSSPSFYDKAVKIRWEPIEYDKPEAFFHTTCKDYFNTNKRVPDFRRCERIRWIRAFIENHKCNLSDCDNCDGIKVWKEPYKNNERVHILLEEEKYIVVLELRKTYILLITAYYFDYDNALSKKLKKFETYKNN